MASLSLGLELPSEVASILPSDPYAQLELAHRICNHALTQKVAELEAEAQQLRESLIQRQTVVKSLDRKVAALEHEVQEMAAKNKIAVEESHRLQGEKGALIDTVKRLNRDLAKLEAFKRSLMQHLHDEEQPDLEPSVAAIDLSSERLVNEVLSSAVKQPAGAGFGPSGHTTTSYPVRGFQASTPSVPSTSGRAPTYSSTGSPRASAQSTPQPQPSTGQYSPPKIDGKEFFRQARARLSYERFTEFLHNIKELNAGRQSRDETLRRTREIFGAAHQDMYSMFENLLARHLTI